MPRSTPAATAGCANSRSRCRRGAGAGRTSPTPTRSPTSTRSTTSSSRWPSFRAPGRRRPRPLLCRLRHRLTCRCHVNLAYDPSLHRYLMAIAELGSWHHRHLGAFLAEDGNTIGCSLRHRQRHRPRRDQAGRGLRPRQPPLPGGLARERRGDGTEYAAGPGLAETRRSLPPGLPIMASSDTIILRPWPSTRSTSATWWSGSSAHMSASPGPRPAARPRRRLVTPAGPEIHISRHAYADTVDVAFDSQSQRYMVVWENLSLPRPWRPAGRALPFGQQIFGQMIDVRRIGRRVFRGHHGSYVNRCPPWPTTGTTTVSWWPGPTAR